MSNVINATKNIINAEKNLYLENPKTIHKRKKFATPSGPSVMSMRPRDRACSAHQKQNAFLPVPDGLSLDNLEEALTPLSEEIEVYRKIQLEKNENVPISSMLEAMRSVGARVLVAWSKDEVGTSGRKSGWFVGTVKQYLKERDTIVVKIDTEDLEGVIYKYDVKKKARAGKIKLSRSTEKKLGSYEDIFQIGAIVEVKWTEDDLAGTEWLAGWYEAEMQSFDYDDDEIKLIFSDEPGYVYRIPVLPSLISGTLRLKKELF